MSHAAAIASAEAAREAGSRAFRDGKPITGNPHGRDADTLSAHNSWRRGYAYAEGEHAAASGLTEDDCPYADDGHPGTLSGYWRRGFRGERR